MLSKMHARFSLLLLTLSIMGCQTTSVERVDPGTTQDLSGYWNDTDSRMVSATMVTDMLSRAWLGEHRGATGKAPTVIVGNIRNLSHEHINVNTFINDIERELINSGRVSFVASSQERGQIRDERADQDLNASEATRSAMGQEIGADYMLIGSINTIVDALDKQQVTFYQVDLTLISMKDNRKVWLGQEKIKKIISGRKYRF
ncbi:MAG: penicillin-binding protein activator LpoB [Pseudomonadota bacterium]